MMRENIKPTLTSLSTIKIHMFAKNVCMISATPTISMQTTDSTITGVRRVSGQYIYRMDSLHHDSVHFCSGITVGGGLG